MVLETQSPHPCRDLLFFLLGSFLFNVQCPNRFFRTLPPRTLTLTKHVYVTTLLHRLEDKSAPWTMCDISCLHTPIGHPTYRHQPTESDIGRHQKKTWKYATFFWPDLCSSCTLSNCTLVDNKSLCLPCRCRLLWATGKKEGRELVRSLFNTPLPYPSTQPIPIT